MLPCLYCLKPYMKLTSLNRFTFQTPVLCQLGQLFHMRIEKYCPPPKKKWGKEEKSREHSITSIFNRLPLKSAVITAYPYNFDWENRLWTDFSHQLLVKGVDLNVTLTRILPLSISGEGRRPVSSDLMLDRSSLSPRISIRYWAIFFCWGTLQWFSMDRMTG